MSLQSLFTSSLLFALTLLSSTPAPTPASPAPPQPFQCPPPLEKPNWDSIPSQLLEFRSSCPRLGGEGARNAGAEAWSAPDRAGSEFWECLCSWSPLGEGAGPLINPSLVPREGPGPPHTSGGVRGSATRSGGGGPRPAPSPQPPAPVESQTGAWRFGPPLRGVHVCVWMECGHLEGDPWGPW